ncbi:Cyclin-B2-4 [Raphanus sativus]|nr:Cyclin-B2-4 [Raphanus sativus]
MISGKAYIRREVLYMEKLMTNALQFNFCLPTPYMFMRRFLKAAQSDQKVELLSFFIIDICLVGENSFVTPLLAEETYQAKGTGTPRRGGARRIMIGTPPDSTGWVEGSQSGRGRGP